MINQQLLIDRGGAIRHYEKNQTIFFEGDLPLFYHQIISGSVRMVNVRENGKEFIQGIYASNESFGETVLVTNDTYPASAIANEQTSVVRLKTNDFLDMLRQEPELHFHFTQVLAKQLNQKSLIAKEIAGYSPHHRVMSILKILKETYGCEHSKYKVVLSRQQLADMIGLRVETVIRCIRKLQKQGTLELEKGKIFF